MSTALSQHWVHTGTKRERQTTRDPQQHAGCSPASMATCLPSSHGVAYVKQGAKGNASVRIARKLLALLRKVHSNLCLVSRVPSRVPIPTRLGNSVSEQQTSTSFLRLFSVDSGAVFLPVTSHELVACLVVEAGTESDIRELH